MSKAEEHPLRKWRREGAFCLDQVCAMFEARGFRRPSAAKLSRIERGQPIPVEMLSEFEAITGIPAKNLAPNVASIFLRKEEEAA